MKALKGFFVAIIIAIISFFVIYFFIPETAIRYLGVSFKEKTGDFDSSPIKTRLDKTKDVITEKINDTNAGQFIQNMITVK